MSALHVWSRNEGSDSYDYSCRIETKATMDDVLAERAGEFDLSGEVYVCWESDGRFQYGRRFLIAPSTAVSVERLS